MKSTTFAALFAAALVNALAAVAWDHYTHRLVAQSQARTGIALVER